MKTWKYMNFFGGFKRRVILSSGVAGARDSTSYDAIVAANENAHSAFAIGIPFNRIFH